MKNIKLTNTEIKLILSGLKSLANREPEVAMRILNYGNDYESYDKRDMFQKISELRGMLKQMLRD